MIMPTQAVALGYVCGLFSKHDPECAGVWGFLLSHRRIYLSQGSHYTQQTTTLELERRSRLAYMAIRTPRVLALKPLFWWLWRLLRQ